MELCAIFHIKLIEGLFTHNDALKKLLYHYEAYANFMPKNFRIRNYRRNENFSTFDIATTIFGCEKANFRRKVSLIFGIELEGVKKISLLVSFS